MARRGENIYKRKDGRWEGRYIKKRKNDGSICFGYVFSHSYQELRKQLYEEKLSKAELNFNYKQRKAKGIKVELWVMSWLLKQKKNVRYNTYISYESKMKYHVLPYFSDFYLVEITKKDIQNWLEKLYLTLKASSVKVIVRIFSMCLNDAVAEEIIIKNPINGVRLIDDNSVNTTKAFSQEEQKRIEEQIFKTEKTVQTYFPCYLTLYTGLRVGELTGLKWEDVNFEEKYLFVQRSVQRIKTEKNKSMLMETKTKTISSQRTIPLSSDVIYWLKIWEKKNKNSSEYIIYGRNGNPMDQRN